MPAKKTNCQKHTQNFWDAVLVLQRHFRAYYANEPIFGGSPTVWTICLEKGAPDCCGRPDAKDDDDVLCDGVTLLRTSFLVVREVRSVLLEVSIFESLTD